MELKKNAVDLTDLAIGILVLGIVVTIGATILINIRDNNLTDLAQTTIANESVNVATSGSDTFANQWVTGTTATCLNATGDTVVLPGNYSIAVSGVDGTATISNTTLTGADVNNAWNCTYNTYDTTRADWAVANDAATGIAEYGNWFDIIVIVGIAGVILSLIFMAFGKAGSGSSELSY